MDYFDPMLIERWVSYYLCRQNLTSYKEQNNFTKGQANSPGKLPDQKENKARRKQTYHSMHIYFDPSATKKRGQAGLCKINFCPLFSV